MSSLAALSSTLSQRILSQSNNISYAARGAYRMSSVPEDRKADYLFRDFYMVMVTGVLTELGFRLADQMYSFPQMTKALELNKLAELYKPGNDPYGKFGDKIRNFTSIDQISDLRKRLTGSLVSSDSVKLIPTLLDESDFKSMTPEARKEMDVLLHHLRRRLNFDGHKGYLETLQSASHLTGDEVAATKKGMEALTKLETFLKDLNKITGLKSVEAPAALKEEQLKTAQEALQYLETHFSEGAPEWLTTLKQKIIDKSLPEKIKPTEWEGLLAGLESLPAKLKSLMPAKVVALVEDGLHSKTLINQLKSAQKNSFWPKMGGSILLSLIFYGIIASIIDNRLIQPWQKKLYEKRGTTSEVMAPTYWSLIPAGVALVGSMSDKFAPAFIKKMGYVNRFLFAGVLSMGVYTGSIALMLRNKLSKPPALGTVAPAKAPAFSGPGAVFSPPLSHPQIFKQFEQAKH